jgi:hypothetical protein
MASLAPERLRCRRCKRTFSASIAPECADVSRVDVQKGNSLRYTATTLGFAIVTFAAGVAVSPLARHAMSLARTPSRRR